MALATTTLSAAVSVNDVTITVASATSVAAGRIIICDGEQMQVVQGYVSGTTVGVLRGRGGTATKAHASGANVVHGLATDFADPGVGGYPINWPNMRTRSVTSYTADGAIALPVPGTDAFALLNGTSQWDMTLANPTKDMDGCLLYIIGNGKAAHTVTYAAGLGNASTGYTVLTFDTGGQCCVILVAANGIWVPAPSPLSGTLTAVDVAVS